MQVKLENIEKNLKLLAIPTRCTFFFNGSIIGTPKLAFNNSMFGDLNLSRMHMS